MIVPSSERWWPSRYGADDELGTLNEITPAKVMVAARLVRTGTFLRDVIGRRTVFGTNEVFQTDPQWRDYLPFHEYFHGDTGSGVGEPPDRVDGTGRQTARADRREVMGERDA